MNGNEAGTIQTRYKMNIYELKNNLPANFSAEDYLFNTNEYKAGQHYKFVMELGRIFPATKAQAKYFINQKNFPYLNLDVLNLKDAEKIAAFMAENGGFEANFKFTKSKTWVRLTNNDDLKKAVKIKFEI